MDNILRWRKQVSVDRQYLSITLRNVTTHKHNMGLSYS